VIDTFRRFNENPKSQVLGKRGTEKGNVRRYLLPVAEETVKAKNEIFFVGGDLAALDGWSKIVHPAEAAALAAA
jgi:hypothetical protein